MVSTLSKDRVSDVLARQITRSATSVAANYRAACRARTKVEFASKIGLVEEEADETVFWMEMLVDSGVVKTEKMKVILAEAKEILAIVTATRKTVKNNNAARNN